MDPGDRGGGQELEREVAIGHGVDRVRGRPVEPERGRGRQAIDREAGAGKRRRAERAFVQPRPGVGHAAAVAPEHLDIGEEMMAERHRLRRLQVGEPGHDRIRVLLGALEQRRLQLLEQAIALVEGVAHPHANVGRDLVVARARGVELAARARRSAR